jgi:hypothetical protein
MPGYFTYTQARDAAWRFLLINHIRELPVMLFDICDKNYIELYRDPGYIYLKPGQHGVTFVKGGKFFIVTNGLDPLDEQRFTIAHELGHIFLRHPMTNDEYGRNYGVRIKPQTPAEYQAERFAMNILAPAGVLWKTSVTKAEDIATICKIPLPYAKWRADRLRELGKRNKFGTSLLERNVMHMFTPYIDHTQKPEDQQ